MKITLDTNILVSGTFWSGDSFKILKLVDQRKIELIISEEIIKEYYKVINSEEIIEKIKGKNLILNKSVQKIILNSTIVIPKEKFNMVKEDKEDNKILECAFEGKADYVTSKDNHLLKLKEFKGIKIINPKEFLKILKGL